MDVNSLKWRADGSSDSKHAASDTGIIMMSVQAEKEYLKKAMIAAQGNT
jgi:hypothetical protein